MLRRESGEAPMTRRTGRPGNLGEIGGMWVTTHMASWVTTHNQPAKDG